MHHSPAIPSRLACRRKQRHHSLATYILLRGLTLLVRTGNKPDCRQRHPLLHALLAPTRMEHGDTLLMCIATSQIIYSFIVMPSTLPPVGGDLREQSKVSAE